MKNVHISKVFDLWCSYQEIKFRFTAHQTISAVSYCIVTACNPGSTVASEMQNKLRMEKLQRYIDTTSFECQKVLCSSPDYSWNEPSFAVAMPVVQCVTLAKLYKQNAIYQVKEGALWLVPALIKGVDSLYLGKMANYINIGPTP